MNASSFFRTVSFLVLIFLSVCAVFSASAETMKPVNLRCEYKQNPLGIDIAKPRFSWNFLTPERNQFQSACEILVSDNIAAVTQFKGNVWQVNVNSNQNIQLEYAGKALASFTRYYWRVRIRDESGNLSSWSEVAWFETAMMSASDWRAKWIGDGKKNPAADADYYKDRPMPLFKHSFSIGKKITAARLYISGLGYYEAYLNGKKIGDHVLDPGFTTFRKQVQYAVYDITPMLVRGNNVAGIMLGNGWWNPLPFKFFGRWDLREYQQTGTPCVKAEFHLKYADGKEEIISTDEHWITAPGATVQNNVYLGETCDGRLLKENWNTTQGDDTGWAHAAIVDGPAGVLTVQTQPPVKVTRILKPVAITEKGKDTFLVDLGQNFAGVASIKVSGPAGTHIHIRYGETLFEDGSINLMTAVATQIKKGGIKGGPGAPETAWQEDDYILRGKGIEEWSPKFTFHGFRYLEITGWPGVPSPDQVSGLRMNADLPANGTFSCSNDLLNRIHETVQWTFLSNVFSVQSDCPGREKMGYGGDMVATANAFLYNYDMADFYGKAVHDFANEQRPQGGITEIAPFTGIADRGYGDDSGPLGWELAFPYLQQQLYWFYGDKRIIENQYPAFQRQLKFLESKSVEHLFYWDISDHEALDPKPEAFSASAFYYEHLRIGASFAGILGKTEDSVSYAKKAARVLESMLEKFLVKGTGRFDNGTQSAQTLALGYGITPEKENSFKILLQELERHDFHLWTGIFTTKMIFDVLRENERNDLAYQVVNQRGFPGWGFMLGMGATTLWESWAFPGTGYSCNHPMFGSVDEWFYRSLLGINATAPGFSSFLIKPQPAGDLVQAKGSYHSVRGEIVSDWRKEKDKFFLHVVIPANTSARIFLPVKPGAGIREGGKQLETIPGIRDQGEKNGYHEILTGGGEYFFETGE